MSEKRLTASEQSASDRAKSRARSVLAWSPDSRPPDAPRLVWTTSGVSDEFQGAFKDAGDVLAQRIDATKGSPNWVNALVVPMLYCYRHSLELAIKNVSTQIEKLRALEHGGRLPNSSELTDIDHSLARLWRRLKEQLHTVDPEIPVRPLIEQVVARMQQVDPYSTRLRFQRDEHDDPPDRTLIVDTHGISMLMKDALDEVLGYANYIEVLIQQQQDAIANRRGSQANSDQL